MAKQSAGILAYRIKSNQAQVLLVHPGGPFFIKKDLGVWSIPKGEIESGEDTMQVAKREFEEETGNIITSDQFFQLPSVKSKSGKILHVWGLQADFERPFIRSNNFEMEWPPKSGKMQSFPEADKAEWFSFQEACKKVYPYQIPLIEALEKLLQ
jgi:predicted NUDIX family NTP pyrophosphohydrolase